MVLEEEIRALYCQIGREFPRNSTRLEIYPGGAAFLDVKVGTETYVMEYHANVGIGISRISTATYGWEGYEHSFDNFRSAREHLLALLRGDVESSSVARQPLKQTKTNRRIYPPQPDSVKKLPDGTIRAESRGHFSYYLPDGGIQIVEKETGKPIFEK
jgi:hypothetical protein